jgi:hypothetical protein
LWFWVPFVFFLRRRRQYGLIKTDKAYKRCKSTKLASKKSLDQGVWAKQAKWFASHIGALVLDFFWLAKQGNQRKCEVLEFV